MRPFDVKDVLSKSRTKITSHEMKITIHKNDISKVRSDALIGPVDGNICAFGGCAAATALRKTIPCETPQERMGLFEEILCHKPIPFGDAKFIEVDEYDLPWNRLLIISALPHHVNGEIFSPDKCESILAKAIQNGVGLALREGINSIATTLIGDSYRMPPELSVRAMLSGFKTHQDKSIDINWCFLDEYKMHVANKGCVAFGFKHKMIG
ncbi:hypothetical protein [Maridesulfovibrio sp.]|uniref:hypothetical protein n=1 Tax=Maridesulfovibrio sp. TaxID=2795000 RepID=UPI002AA6E9AE|nr:hypothetical protein [Maridesulfovibrio sp.]